MKFVVILFTLLQISVAMAAPKKLAAPPTYTPNNPYGKWTALPTGKNYLFCGDRVIYGSSFEEKIKINYNGSDRVLSIREHCEMRRRELERSASARTAEEPTMIQLQYEKLAGYLMKVPGGVKAGRQYSLREIRKAMKASEVNDLRAANLMLPILTEPEFSKLYAGETNNPQFTKTEHERYISNLMTQNPAMLYTANGSLFYFSLNLSNDQLKLMAKVVGSGGGGGGSGSSGGSGGRSAGSKGNSEVGSGGRRQMSDALEGARQNPFEGSKMASQLNVKPQATTLPSSFGVDSNATFVPYDMKMPSISRGADRSVASSGSARADRVKAVTVSSNPSLGMMNIGGMGRSGSGSSIGGTTRSGSGSSSNSSGNSVANKPSGAAKSGTSGGDQTTSWNGAASTIDGSGDTIINGSNQGVRSQARDRSGTVGASELPSTIASNGPLPVRFGEIDRDLRPFEKPNYSCKPNEWRDMMYHSHRGNNQIADQCYPMDSASNFSTPQFCAEGKVGSDFNTLCVYDSGTKPEEVSSCYDQIIIDVGNICKKYLDIPESFNLDSLVRCAETMFALTCNKIPCEIKAVPTLDESGKETGTISDLSIEDIENSAVFETVELRLKRGQTKPDTRLELKNFSEIHQIQYVNNPSADNEPRRNQEAHSVKVNLKSEIKEEFWKKSTPNVSQVTYTNDMVMIGLFYEAQLKTKCKFENNTYKIIAPNSGSN